MYSHQGKIREMPPVINRIIAAFLGLRACRNARLVCLISSFLWLRFHDISDAANVGGCPVLRDLLPIVLETMLMMPCPHIRLIPRTSGLSNTVSSNNFATHEVKIRVGWGI